jgi:4-hydroxy-tetrahydrodipicolinate reductase
MSTNKTRVAVVGAGPIGALTAQQIRARSSLALTAVVDVDPNKLGTDVAGVSVSAKIPDGVDVAVLTTTSSLAKLTPLALDVIAKKMHVISTCEELAWPWSRPELARRLDDAAKSAGVAVLGTGVNPGFLMDALPLFLTAPLARVDKVRVERVQDASRRRKPFQDKVGVGMAVDDVRARLRDKTMGHVGLAESAAMLAARLGFDVDEFSEDFSVVADANLASGVEQVGRATSKGKVVVELYFRAAAGEPHPRDRIVLDGEPPLEVEIKGGVPGDLATAAIVTNAIPSLLAAKPGLRTMADVPIPSCIR